MRFFKLCPTYDLPSPSQIYRIAVKVDVPADTGESSRAYPLLRRLYPHPQPVKVCRTEILPDIADFPPGAAHSFKHDVHNLVHHVVLAKMRIFNVVNDDFTVNLKCFIFSACRFLSLPIRRRSRLSLVHGQRKGVRGKDRNGIGTWYIRNWFIFFLISQFLIYLYLIALDFPM